MKIISASSILLRLPYRAPGPDIIAGRPEAAINVLQIRIETEDGVVGWGEAFGHALAPTTKMAFDTLIAPLLLGQRADNIDAISLLLNSELHLYGRNGAVTYAISGVDIALWDIAGKRAGLPLYKLLGAPQRDTVPAYASLLRCGAEAPLIRTCETAIAQGFTRFKLHEVAPALVGCARKTIGPSATLMVDVNCPWRLDAARVSVDAMRAFDLEWLEEPIFPPEDRLALAALRAEGVPIAAGENIAGPHEFQAMFEAGALDIAQPSVAKIGGISVMLKMAQMCANYKVRFQPHCAYFGSGYLASLHLAAAFEGTWFERLFAELVESPFAPFDRIENGEARVPQAPGLGCDPDPEVLARCAVLA